MSWLSQFPGGPDALSLIACLALTAAVMTFLFMIDPDPADSAPRRSHLDQLMERRDIIYDNLRDLKFEYRSGKFAEQDYEQMKQTLENEAAVILVEIESAAGNQVYLPRGAAAAVAKFRG